MPYTTYFNNPSNPFSKMFPILKIFKLKVTINKYLRNVIFLLVRYLP